MKRSTGHRLWHCAFYSAVCTLLAAQSSRAQDAPPRQAPATLDGGAALEGPIPSQPVGPMPGVAPAPAPFGSAGPVGPMGPVGPVPYGIAPPPPPPEFWRPTNPAGEQRGWLQGEFLVWWIKAGPNPTPLATTGDINGPNPGALGQTTPAPIILGANNFNYDSPAGMRFSGGYWFGDRPTLGIDASIFFLDDQHVHQGVGSDDFGNPAIYRPVRDVNFGETSLFVAIPGLASGAMFVSSSSQLWGADVNGLFRLTQQNTWNLDVIGGFRFLNLRETLDISTITNDFAGVLPGPATGGFAEVPGSTLAVFDNFRAVNNFYGGQFGMQTAWAFAPRWYLGARVLVGLGDTRQTIDISGLTVQNQPGIGVTTAPAGALATASNSGHFTHDAFSVVPEAQLKLGYQFSPRFNGFIGYNFLYWSNVVHPGNQISRSVDLQAIPTSGIYNPAVAPAAPGPPSFSQTGFWAQGINFGLQFSY